MTAERWRRIEDLFHRAVDLSATQRHALLATECAGDSELRAEVERLLRGDVAGDDAFTRIESLGRAPVADPMLGRDIGAWRLCERIGSGGMGIVYRARRADGVFEQEVAVKLIRAEMATGATRRRFDFERRTLATLQHPCIAKLFDGGTTADDQPWFAMELVRGEPIDAYCARRRSPLIERLRLFVQVCRAVHHAHRNLVVHCDLKPGNILIDDRGQPHLLDFGIARMLAADPGQATPTGNTLLPWLTPEYASPEQLAGQPVTTAHDIWSLGVILHELATGRRLFADPGRGPADWERTIRGREADRPSSVVLRTDATRNAAAVATTFATTAAALHRALRGDIDRIVQMALRHEPERRYPSALELAEDIERHLGGLPVHARPPTFAYRAAKFVRRNRVAVAAGLAVTAALVVGLVAARRAEASARTEARHAAKEADSFQGIADFLMDAFLPTQPAADQAWQDRARTRILAQARRVQRQFADDDHERANLLDMLGQVCLRLDLLADGEQLMRSALEVRRQTFGPGSLEYARSLRSLGQLLFARGSYAEAADLLGQALELQRRDDEGTHADVAAVANDLAACLRNLGRLDDAETLHREALALRQQRAPRSLPVAESLNNLAAIHLAHGDPAAAVATLREALAIRSAILDDGHLLTLQTMSNLAGSLWRQGNRAEAREMSARCEKGLRALGNDADDALAILLDNAGSQDTESRDLVQAIAHFAESAQLSARRLGKNHPRTLATSLRLAQAQHAHGDDADAAALYESLLPAFRAPSANPLELAAALQAYAILLLDTGAHARARQLASEAADVIAANAPHDARAIGSAEFLLGRCLLRCGDRDGARAHLKQAAQSLESAVPAAVEQAASARRLLEALDRSPPK